MRGARSVFKLSGTVALVALSAAGSARATGDDGDAETPADRELATEARLPTILRVIGEREPRSPRGVRADARGRGADGRPCASA